MQPRNLRLLIFSIIITQMAGIVGSVFTTSSVQTWYPTLTKPSFNPPNSFFGPVWVTLYTLIGISLYLIWVDGIKKKENKVAIKVFAFQLILNTLWSIVFFGMQNISLGLIVILGLLFAIVYTIILFAKIDKRAAYLLVPYILWVSFATFLNYSIWILN